MHPPIHVCELDLGRPAQAIELPPGSRGGLPYTAVLALVRLHGDPVGYATLAPGALDAASVAGQVHDQLGDSLNARLAAAGLPPLQGLPPQGIPALPAPGPAARPPISVVVCTRDRPESLAATLPGVLAQRYPDYEVIIVDNAPSSAATRELVACLPAASPRLRYVAEPRPGLSRARNRGVAEAASDIIAFTDDDVRVDSGWLDGIAAGFAASPQVRCVTGLVATAQLENIEQLYFHLRHQWGRACQQRVFDLREHRHPSPLYPYQPGLFGTGANFALTRAAWQQAGGFDESLGAGTPAGGGEDLDMFMRVVLSGGQLAYQPSAIVWHYHRSGLAELTRQMRAYGTGLSAAMTAMMVKRPRSWLEIPPRAARGAARVLALSRRVAGPQAAGLPPELMRQEVRGMLAGPWLYLRERWRPGGQAAAR